MESLNASIFIHIDNFPSLSRYYDENFYVPKNMIAIYLPVQVQRMRTQMAKLNHRLMAMELESQQQNQRWQVHNSYLSN